MHLRGIIHNENTPRTYRMAIVCKPVLGIRLVLPQDGVFYCIKHEVLAMKASGGGSIVNTASSSGIRATMCSSDYTAAKHGVIGLTKASAIDAAPFGIRINAICPGLTLTEMTRDRLMNDPTFSVALEGIRQRHIIGRFGEPQEIANAMTWLLSDLSSFQTGSSMLVDGGFSI